MKSSACLSSSNFVFFIYLSHREIKTHLQIVISSFASSLQQSMRASTVCTATICAAALMLPLLERWESFRRERKSFVYPRGMFPLESWSFCSFCDFNFINVKEFFILDMEINFAYLNWNSKLSDCSTREV